MACLVESKLWKTEIKVQLYVSGDLTRRSFYYTACPSKATPNPDIKALTGLCCQNVMKQDLCWHANGERGLFALLSLAIFVHMRGFRCPEADDVTGLYIRHDQCDVTFYWITTEPKLEGKKVDLWRMYRLSIWLGQMNRELMWLSLIWGLMYWKIYCYYWTRNQHTGPVKSL